jgi:hypothetical protein
VRRLVSPAALVVVAGAAHEIANVERRMTIPVRTTVNDRLKLNIKSITSGKRNNVLEKYSFRNTCWQMTLKRSGKRAKKNLRPEAFLISTVSLL